MATENFTYDQLRKKAESKVSRNIDLNKIITLDEAKEILHELEVHQIELEMQNEELRVAQHHLEEVRDRYTDLFDFAPVGYLVLDKKGIIVNINLTACNLLGTERALIKGKPLSAFMESAESRKLFLKLKDAFNSGNLEAFELEMKHKNKTLFTVSFQGVISKNENQSDSVCRISFQDITKVKEAKALLKQNKEIKKEKEILQQYLDFAPIAYILLDKNYLIQMINQKGCQLLGIDFENLSGKYGFDNFIDTSVISTTVKTLQNNIIESNTIPTNFESTLQSTTGKIHIMSWTNVTLFDKKGKFLGTLMAGEDISERKKAEKRKEEYTQDLEAVVEQRTKKLTEALHNEKMINEMKTAFVSMASHEFRTPLTSVMTSAILIKKYIDLKQYDKQFLHIERIKSSVKQLTDILEDFLSLDKLERGIVTTNDDIFDLKIFIKEIFEELEWDLKEKQIIEFDFTGNPIIGLDKKILHNILINLLSNAIKYSNTKILLSVKVTNEFVFINIHDKGIGIPEEEQKYLFTKFFRAKNANEIHGTGLGLSIVKHYVDLLKGEITFKSKLNVGTKFTLSLPLNK